MRDLADALGWYTVPVPELAVDATAEVVARLPFLPEETTWIEALRRPVLMDTTKARRAALAPPARRARDAAPDRRRLARGPQRVTSVTGTPKRRWASPATSSSR